MLSPGEPRAVKKPDGRGGHDKEPEKRFLLAALFQSWFDGANHQKEPNQKAHKKENLPTAAEVHVFITLMAPEKGIFSVQFVVDAHPFAGKGTSNDEKKRAEQHVDSEALIGRLILADQRTNEKSRGKPRGGD